jgi:ribonuclease-3
VHCSLRNVYVISFCSPKSYVGGLCKDQNLEAVRAWLTPLLLPYIRSAYATIRAQYGLPPLPASPPTPANEPIEPGAEAGARTDMYSDQNPSAPGEITYGVGNPELISTPSLVGHGSPFRRYEYPPLYTKIHTTAGHLALFNQRVQKKQVEWIYAFGVASPPDSTTANPAMSPGSEAQPTLPTRRAKSSTPVWMVRVLIDGEFYGKGKGGTKRGARNEAAKEGLAKLGIVVW